MNLNRFNKQLLLRTRGVGLRYLLVTKGRFIFTTLWKEDGVKSGELKGGGDHGSGAFNFSFQISEREEEEASSQLVFNQHFFQNLYSIGWERTHSQREHHRHQRHSHHSSWDQLRLGLEGPGFFSEWALAIEDGMISISRRVSQRICPPLEQVENLLITHFH